MDSTQEQRESQNQQANRRAAIIAAASTVDRGAGGWKVLSRADMYLRWIETGEDPAEPVPESAHEMRDILELNNLDTGT